MSLVRNISQLTRCFLIVSKSLPCKTDAFVNLSSVSPCCSENLMDKNKYEKLSAITLEDLQDKFEEILETNQFTDSDVQYSDGVLTVNLAKYGTYVINKQTPTRQIWLSSPISGPKRFDYINGKWVYSRDNSLLKNLLNEEISSIVGMKVDFGD